MAVTAGDISAGLSDFGSSTLLSRYARAPGLGTHFEHPVEWGLAGPAEAAETGVAKQFGSPLVGHLVAQRVATGLGFSRGGANADRAGVEDPADRFTLFSSPATAIGSTSSQVPSAASDARMWAAAPTGSPMSCNASKMQTSSYPVPGKS